LDPAESDISPVVVIPWSALEINASTWLSTRLKARESPIATDTPALNTSGALARHMSVMKPPYRRILETKKACSRSPQTFTQKYRSP